MKKFLSILMAMMLVLALAACGGGETPPVDNKDDIEMTEKIGVTIPAFSLYVNGKTVTDQDMADYAVYEVQATSVNSSGTESTVTYVGFSLADVFTVAGVTEYESVVATADDGYAVEVKADVASKANTLVAITKDGEQFKASPWFAPCSSGTTGDYLKGMVAITLNGEAADLEAIANGGKDGGSEGGLPEISDKTDKVTFSDYSFKVNGAEVTNATLEGLSIYKITVNVTNSKGATSESTYTGYKLADVLKAAGVESYTTVKAVANDGYETSLTVESANSDYTLLAIEKDKELGEDGTVWVAPCEETSSGSYCKLVVEVVAE